MTSDLARTDDAQRSLAVADREQAAGALAHVLGTGDLYQLTNEQRVAHYLNLCDSLTLNALSRPFQWIEFKEGENSPAVLTLYFKPAGAAQMLRNHHVSVHYTRKEIVGELFVCEAEGQTPDGRKGTATKYVPLTGKYGRLTGRYLANAFMSAETGALRRLALSMFGLSTGPDVDEVASWRAITVDGTGRVLDNPTQEQRYLAETPSAAAVVGEPTFESVGRMEGPPLAGTTGQQVRSEELEQPRRPSGPPATFHCDKARWSRIWATLPNNIYLNDTDARRHYIGSYTSTWPEAARTDSLSRLLDIVTDAQAERFINDSREYLAELAGAEAADPDGELEGIDGLTNEQAAEEAALQRGNDNRPPDTDNDLDTRLEAATTKNAGRPRSRTQEHSRQDVRSAAQIAGMAPREPSPAARPAKSPPVLPEEPDWLRSDEQRIMAASWQQWTDVLRRLDPAYEIKDATKLTPRALVAELRVIVSYARHTYESCFGSDVAIEEVGDDETTRRLREEAEALDRALADDEPADQPEPAPAF